MTLLSVERIKLFTTRSPYWCLAGILVAALLFALLLGLVDGGREAATFTSQAGMQLGLMVFMVLAALAVTTEYRFGTIRASFLATPRRFQVLLAKTIVIVLLGAVVALVCSFAAFFLTKALAGSGAENPPSLSSGADWRMVLGNVALFPIAAIIAVSVGTIVRHSAGAITILMLWPLLIENLVTLIPTVGSKIQLWLPFQAVSTFITPPAGTEIAGQVFGTSGPTPVEGLLVFLGTAVVLWLVALTLLQRRDA